MKVIILIFITLLFAGCDEFQWDLPRDNPMDNTSEETEDTTPEVITDYDGNTYKTVKIGDQTWMAENLKTTHYADGTPIDLVENASAWESLGYEEKAYSYYDNSSANIEAYGLLYTWSAAVNGNNSSSGYVQGVCPDGWHLPGSEEWDELEAFISNDGNKPGEALKSTDGWYNNGNGTNHYGFNALPAGKRWYDGKYDYAGENAVFWSATESGSSHGYFRSLSYSGSYIYSDSRVKDEGYSVRCVKD